MVATLGFIGAISMVAPDFLQGIPWLSFGRVRPIHTNLMIFGFVGAALLGGIHYFVPSLVRSPLYSENLGRATLWVYNLAMASGTVTLALGYTQSREYAEWIWPVDVLVLLSLAMIFYNLLRTVLLRQEKLLYVSVWYAFALVFTFLIYFSAMPSGIHHRGHQRNARRHPGLVLRTRDRGLFLTPLAVAVAYYVIPSSVSPLRPHSVPRRVLVDSHVLPPHRHSPSPQTPAPTWLKVVAVTGSIGMLIPVQTVLFNLWLTMRERLKHSRRHRGKVCLRRSGVVHARLPQGLQSCPGAAFDPPEQLGDRPCIAVLGFSGFIGLGPSTSSSRITGRPLYSSRLATSVLAGLIGLAGFFIVLTTAGLIRAAG
jgi:cbb3-type cytochrome oxidase subunit 1